MVAQKIQIILNEKAPPFTAVYLFGSASTGHLRAKSDIDIGVLFKQPIANTQRYELASVLSLEFNRDVDLVDLRECSTVMAYQIIASGTRIYAKPKTDADAFEIRCAGLYFDLNDERQGILDDINERGSVYG